MRSTPLVLACVSVFFAFSASASAQTLGCVGGGTGGPVPTAGTGGGGTFPSVLPTYPGVYTLNVPSIPAGASVLTEVKVLGITHTAAGELQFVLTSPSGVSHNVVALRGGSCDYAGDYVFVPACSTVQVSPWTCSGLLVPGVYQQWFGLWPDGQGGILNAALTTIPAEAGAWTLTVYDWSPGDIGIVNSWELCFGLPPSSAPVAPGGAPTPTAPQDGSTLFGPAVRLGWFADPCATSYDIEVNGAVVGSATSSSFEYSASSAGVHEWRVRARNAAGVGPWSVVHTYTDLGVLPTPCAGSELTTLFARNNSVAPGGMMYFDVDVLSPAGILVSEIAINTGAQPGTAVALYVYVKSGTHVGFATTPSAWTLVGTAAGAAAGLNLPTLIDVPDFQLSAGLHGMGLILTGGAHAITNGTGGNQFYANSQVALSLGQSQHTPFLTSPASARVWNGSLRYNCIPPPLTYCTAGVTSSGCSAAIAADAQPSATLASACSIEVSGVEGDKQGLVFYGVDNAGFTPLSWGAGSTSYFCVKPPVRRAIAMNSGGTAGQCDGALALDWNAHQAANPGSLGNPFMVGAKVYVQGWFRDPPAPRATSLSNALELTVGP